MKSASCRIHVRREKVRCPVTESFVRGTARKILRALGLVRVELSCYLVDDKTIRSLNRRYLKHDRPTDVMAFGPAKKWKRPLGSGGPRFLGDLVISAETAVRAAREEGVTIHEETALYLCHGILHLLGHRDGTCREALEMKKKQEKILGTLRSLGSGR